MKTLIYLATLMIMSFASKSQNTLSLSKNHTTPKASIEEVAWIAGHWKGEAFGGITEEIWSPPMGNSMMATFRLIVNEQVSFYEIETITEENGTLVLRLKHFHANLKGWEEKDETVDFPLVKLEANRALFDGLTFEKISDDKMNIYVTIENNDGKAEEMKFAYKMVMP